MKIQCMQFTSKFWFDNGIAGRWHGKAQCHNLWTECPLSHSDEKHHKWLVGNQLQGGFDYWCLLSKMNKHHSPQLSLNLNVLEAPLKNLIDWSKTLLQLFSSWLSSVNENNCGTEAIARQHNVSIRSNCVQSKRQITEGGRHGLGDVHLVCWLVWVDFFPIQYCPLVTLCA